MSFFCPCLRVITASASATKSCALDQIPTFMLRDFVDVLLPYVTCMVSASLSQGQLPESQKHAVVSVVSRHHLKYVWYTEFTKF